ncbi:MAG TPA: adenylate/guanylate cyclase domain-containing protein [Burkholderiaceae bacterium]
MEDAAAALKQMNRTLIGSVLFIDIVNYSMSTVPDQLAMKEAFIDLLVEAIQNVAPADRIMVDTGDGAGIAFLGDPEDALFTALTLRDAIESGQVTVGEPGFVRMGINLGPLKVVRDINGHTNMIGDAVNDAQRVMSFAEPGQVMVSHSYYDIISRFSRDYNKLFVHEGTRHDKHVREHQVYRFGPEAATADLANRLRDRGRARSGNTGTFAWQEDDPPAAAPAVTPGPATAAATTPAPSRSKPANGASKPASPAPPASEAAAAPANKMPRKGLMIGLAAFACVACLAAIIGTVWSSTSSDSIAVKPESLPDAPVAAAASSPAQEQAAPASAPAPATPEAIVAKAPTAGAAVTNVAPTSATAASASASASAFASAPSPAAAKPGTLRLVIHPWGEIYVDGSKRGVSPPISSLSLAPGKHRIEIRNGQFAPQRQTVEVKSGGESTLNTTF